MAVAGESVKQALGAESMLLDAPQLYAEMVHVETVMARLAQQNRFESRLRLVREQINDVAGWRPVGASLYGSGNCGFDGWLWPYGASITAKGLKQTFSCAPRLLWQI